MVDRHVLVLGNLGTLSRSAECEGLGVVVCDRLADAEKQLGRQPFDFIVADVEAPGAVDFLAKQRRSRPEIARIVVAVDAAGTPSLIDAINRIRPSFVVAGAFDAAGLQRAVEASLEDSGPLPRSVRERVLLEAADRAEIGIWSYDVRERVVHLLDDRVRRIFGVPSGATDIETLRQLIDPADLARIDSEVAAAISERRALKTHFTLVTPAGEQRTVELRGSTVTEEGKPRWFVGVDIDVTAECDRELARAGAEADREMVLRVANVGTWMADPEREIFRCDSRCQQMFRFPVRDGPELLDLWARGLHREDRDAATASFEAAIRQQAPYAATFRYYWPDGSVRHLVARGQHRTRADGSTSLSGVVVDVTESTIAELLLRASESRLRMAAEMARLGVWELDLVSGRIGLDTRACEIAGTDEAVVSLGWLEARTSPDQRGDARAALRRLRRTGCLDLQVEFLRDDGMPVTAWIRGAADAAVCQKVVRGVVSALPDSAPRPRPSSRTFSLGVLDSLPSQIAVLDAQGNIVVANRAWVEHLRAQGVPPRERPDYLDFYRGVRDPDDEEIRRRIDDLLTGHRRSLSFDYPAGDPEHDAWFNVLGSRFDAGDGPRVVLQHVEITQRLRALYALGAASAEAREASKAKSRFIAGVSHEIRTPLNAILGHAELLARDRELNPEVVRHLDAIRRSGEHLLDLISGVLELSGAEGDDTETVVARFDPADLLDDVEAVFGARARAKGLSLVTRCVRRSEEPLETDIGKVRQILINLVDNAVKFTQRGHVLVRVEVAPAGESQRSLVIEVLDSGPGLCTAASEVLFEPFRSLPVAGGEATGAGLGLAISREYARALGGRLTASDRAEGGARFRLELDVSLASIQTPEIRRMEPVRLAPDTADKRLLVVDDNQDNLVVIARMLEPVGYQVYPATSGQEALGVLEEIRPDAVLLDLRMPGMDGWQTTRTMLEIEPATLIIAVSASVSPEVRRKAIAAGARAFVGKPYRRVELLELLGELLGVEYEYAQQDGARRGAKTSSVEDISDEIRSDLHAAAAAGDLQRLEDLVTLVGERHGELALYLRGLVDGFEIDTLLELTEPRPAASEPF